MARSRLPHLRRAQHHLRVRDQVLPNAPLTGWLLDAEVEALNHALTIVAGFDLKHLSDRVQRLLRAAYAMKPPLPLGRTYHAPLVKLSLPVIIGAASPSKLYAQAAILELIGKNQYHYYSPRVVYTVDQFERYRPTIEAMWRGPVGIDRLTGPLGGVCIYPLTSG